MFSLEFHTLHVYCVIEKKNEIELNDDLFTKAFKYDIL